MILPHTDFKPALPQSETPLPYENEHMALRTITQQLMSSKALVTNKDIIIKLIELLETEKCDVQKDIFRNVLESLLRTTPDDL
ncbi:biofilm development regulator YmgB/AriR family protein [Buttiauxella sp.]|uniref:biofilm development regulator YmgB/AriR family protein n=1 Tax=Buttiauxella sp. TaxID=1972222 RepID=UPI003C72F0F2